MTIYERLEAFFENYKATYGDTQLTTEETLKLCMNISVAVASALIIFHEEHRGTDKTQTEWAELITTELGFSDKYLATLLDIPESPNATD